MRQEVRKRNNSINKVILLLAEWLHNKGLLTEYLPDLVFVFVATSKLELDRGLQYDSPANSFINFITNEINEFVGYELIESRIWEHLNDRILEDLVLLYINYKDQLKLINQQDFVQLLTEDVPSSNKAIPASRIIGEWISQKISVRPECNYLDFGSGMGLMSFYAFSSIGFSHLNWSGVERNKRQASLNQMLILIDSLEINRRNYPAKVINQDPINFQEDYVALKYDFIICSPLFGNNETDVSWALRQKIEDYGLKFNKRIPTEIAYLIRTLDLLDEKGQAFIILPIGFALSSRFSAIRQYLVEQDWIQKVVSFPESTFHPYSSIKVCVLHINKAKPIQQKYLIDLELITSYDKKLYVGSSLFDNSQITSSTITLASYEVSNNNYRIDPDQFHLFKIQEDAKQINIGKHSRLLGDVILRYYTGYAQRLPINSEGTIQCVRIKDLRNDNEPLDIDVDAIEAYIDNTTYSSNKSWNFVKDQSVLVAKVGQKLKPTVFNGPKPAICNGNIIVLEPKPNIILPEYLVLQLRTPEVKRQAELVRSGSVIAHLRQNELLKLRINVPSLEEQQEAVKEFYADKNRQQTDEYSQRFTDYTRRLKHSLAYSVDFLQGQFRLLSGAIERHEPTWLDALANPNARPHIAQRTTIRSLLHKMNSELEHAGETLNLVGEWQKLIQEGAQVSKQDLKQFLLKESESFENECDVTIEGDRMEIMFDPRLFKHLFREVIKNALKHGLYDLPIDVRRIWITFSREKEQAKIIIRNNGLPFPPGFSTERYVSDGGSSNGTGLGGAFINEIVRAHRGSVEITPPEHLLVSVYPVEIIIQIPIN